MATTLPEIMDAIDGVSERLRWLSDAHVKLAERLGEIEDLMVESHAWLHELHEAIADTS